MTLDDYLNSDSAPSAKRFAELVGVSEGSISRIRKGEQNITRQVIRAIIAASDGEITAEGLVNPSAVAEAFAVEECGAVECHADPASPEWPLGSATIPDEDIPSEADGNGEADSRRPFSPPSSGTSPTQASGGGPPPSRSSTGATAVPVERAAPDAAQ